VNTSGSKKNEKDEKVLLIAEDEEVNYMFLETVIRKSCENIRIHHARNGKEAVEICRNAKPDLVLMDIKMPEMNGLDASRRIKEIYPDLKIIVQTAYSTYDERQKARRAGCTGFIEKPINVVKFIDMIKKALYPGTAGS
jgi:YesN/AraC family two-component response regulator